MKIIVEDGTGLKDAVSYVSVAFADDYFLMRGNQTWATLDSDKKAQYLVLASDYVSIRFRYKGKTLNAEQALQFPRKDIGLPINVMKATCEYAIRAIDGNLAPDLIRDDSGLQYTSKKEVIGPIEESYGLSSNGSSTSLQKYKDYPIPDGLLKRYVVGNTGRVIR